ncbi:MAG TPA: hemolysin family protein [bacterium]|nr:hemolysin family protein [bacterium]
MTVFVVSCLIAVGVSFVCSLAEAVLLSVNPLRMTALQQEGKGYAGTWLQLRRQVGRPIAAILILNTVAHTGGATIAGGEFDELFGERWLWLFSTIFTLVILLGTEILPKVLGVTHGERLARVVAPGLAMLVRGLHPLIVITEKFSNLFGGSRETAGAVSAADLQALTRAARADGVLAAEQASIIHNAMRLRELKVSEVMVPREWIVFLKRTAPLRASFTLARGNMHTRYPVSETDDVDGIAGYVNIKEVAVFADRLEQVSIDSFLRSVLLVGPEADLNTMLELFVARRHHLAIVKGRDNRVLGMVTLEDLIEELAGDIQDEFDERNEEAVRVGERTFRVGGALRLATLAARCSLPLPETLADPQLTVDQWLRAQLGGKLMPGQQRQAGAWQFTVQQVRRGHVHQVMLEYRAET